MLGAFTWLTTLELQGGGFAGCDFADPNSVQLPSATLTGLLDISDLFRNTNAYTHTHTHALAQITAPFHLH
jgi:hypothetical protein